MSRIVNANSFETDIQFPDNFREVFVISHDGNSREFSSLAQLKNFIERFTEILPNADFSTCKIYKLHIYDSTSKIQ